jgi:hypothetical protein
MRRSGSHYWLTFLLAASLLAGCRSSSGEQKYPSDPLFLSKRPVVAEAASAPPVVAAYQEPTVPPLPQDGLAQQSAPNNHPSSSAPPTSPNVQAVTRTSATVRAASQ